PRLKAIVVDLDHTLYDGVLGEDGPQGLVLKPEQGELQSTLARLQAEGILLAIASRNDPADVDQVFSVRPDFPLRREQFSAVMASWGPKPESIRQIAADLRIGPDSILFLDDNPGELTAVARELPEVRLLHMGGDLKTAVRALGDYPGLFRWGVGQADALRAVDLAASAMRQATLADSEDRQSYLRSLAVQLDFSLDPKLLLGRLAELCEKTNQFNLGLRRFSEVEVARRLKDPSCRVVAIALRDRLSDSGVIGAVFGRRDENGCAIVEELCISCRALGRGLEDAMVGEAVSKIASGLGVDRVAFDFRAGPRNQPAREWLSRFAGELLAEHEGRVGLDWDADRVQREISALPIAVIWH
ncbi:MAG: HAD-IIIC family phosphatase, partial [Cyanobacteria bacterium REEB65]|nr:HAD-IIIC family phosphatase [Cyanobacteria bacterium REEB65]